LRLASGGAEPDAPLPASGLSIDSAVGLVQALCRRDERLTWLPEDLVDAILTTALVA
jgi:hypothetical protein